MAFKKPSVNKTVATLNKLRIYMRATAKFGKSSAFRNIVLNEYNDPEKGLLVGVGNEIGYTLLSDLNATQVESWRDMIELQKWLIKEKGKEHNIELIAFDTVDELIPLAEKEVIRLSTISTGKPCDSINKAYGGYGSGQAKVKELIKDYFTTLYKAGFGIFCISHTKVKNIVQKGYEDSEGYMVLSSNIANTYNNIFEDMFDCVLTGMVDRDVTDGKVESTTRKLYFRSNNFVEAGCRFGDSVPEYMTFDGDPRECARELVEILKEGLKQSSGLSDVEFKEQVKKEKEQLEKDAEEVVKELEKAEIEEDKETMKELINQLKDKSKDSKNKQILMKCIKESGKSKVSDLTLDEIKDILDKLN